MVAEADEDGVAHLHFDAPPESPTTRGFAGIFHGHLFHHTTGGVHGGLPELIRIHFA